MLQWQPLVLPHVVSSVASAVTAVIMWRRRSVNAAAGALTLVLAGITVWSAGTAAANMLTDLDTLPVSSALIYLGVCGSVAGFFCFAVAMVDRGWRLSRRTALLLLIEPVVAIGAAVTNHLHHQFFARVWLSGSPARLVKSPGPIFWLHTLYSYALLACAILFLVRAWIHAPDTYRRRFTWPLLGVIPPTAANVFGTLIIPGRAVDLTPLGFLITAALCYWAWRNDALPDLLPIARQQVLDTIGEAVLVIDREQRILDLNPAADALCRRLTPGLASQIVGFTAPQVLGTQVPLTSGVDVAHSMTGVMGQPIDLDLRISFVRDRTGNGIGWILVARDVTQLNTQQRQLREQLATIERLRDDLAEQAVRDPLTGLYNRRHLMETLDRAVTDAKQTSARLSVILLDIDHFKTINDTYGHGVGDDVIVAVAGQLAAAVRDGDTVARYGGEEFVVVLPGSSGEQALVRAETIRQRCAGTAVPTTSDSVVATISAGVATFTGHEAPAELLNAADSALYAAKAGGRNRVALVATA